MSFDLVDEFSFMDFDLFQVAQNECFGVLLIALENLDLYDFSVNRQDGNGNTLLHYVAAAGKYKQLFIINICLCTVYIYNNKFSDRSPLKILLSLNI